jgi:D-glycero-D-manno-heptose 1,7-bisphosphate phosphatase
MEPLPGALEAVARLCAAAWPVVVFTNQSGVGRGYLTEADLDAIHDRLRRDVESAGGRIVAIYSCLHAPDAGCDCRKPLPGLLLRAAADHGIDIANSYAVGDTPRDIAAGHAAGCRTVLVLTGHTAVYDAAQFPVPQPDHTFPTLGDFADWLVHEPH